MKMSEKSLFAKLISLIAAFLISICFMSSVSYAAEWEGIIDTSRSGSLTLTHYSVDEELMANVVSHIYLVATVDADGQYTIADEFSDFFADKDFFNNGYDYDEWKNCVAHTDQGGSNTGALENYITGKGISEIASKVSDSEGKTYYTDLKLGVYFVLSDNIVVGEYTHSFINFVYPVPILEKADAKSDVFVNYNPSASPKKAKTRNDVVTHCKLYKRWNDSGNTDKRPSAVTFNISCDGTLMETVTLSSDNNWYHEWSNTGLHDYVVEEVSAGSGYKGSIVITQVGDHDYEYVCTNTYTPPSENPPPSNPPSENPPTDNPPSENPPSDNPSTDTPSEDTITPDSPGVLGAIRNIPEVLGAVRNIPQVLGARRLPQTGQLWWPLPILVIAGVFFIVKGIRKTGKKAC